VATPLELGFDQDDQDFWRHPYPVYERIRETPPGIHYDEDEWVTATHAFCLDIVRGPRWSSSASHAKPGSPAARQLESDELRQVQEGGTLLFLDPPDHTRIRGLASRAFTPRAVGRLRTDIERIAGQLLDEAGVISGGSDAGHKFDVMDALARPLPLYVICQMLGIPEVDRENFFRWSDALGRSLDVDGDPDSMDGPIQQEAILAFMELSQYFFALADDRRAHPGEDLLTVLLQAEEQGDRLSSEELLSLFVLLFVAGHETTSNLIGNGTLALLRNPAELQRLRTEPNLFPGAVDELLRYDAPVQLTARFATEDVPMGDVVVGKGELVVCLIAGANRDPAEFGPTAHLLDVGRDARTHLAFGGGIHYCMGASLARLEGEVAFRILLDRCPSLALADDDPPYRPHQVLRGLASLPVTIA
jgi:cytochrome P450